MSSSKLIRDVMSYEPNDEDGAIARFEVYKEKKLSMSLELIPCKNRFCLDYLFCDDLNRQYCLRKVS